MLNQVKVLNAFCKDGKESLLNISLKEILAIDVILNTVVISDKMDRILRF